MDTVDYVGVTVLVGGLLLIGCLFSYGAAKDTVREQAIAAGVACYKVAQSGTTTFTWNCKQGE